MTALSMVINNIEDVYSELFTQYCSEYSVNKRILLEQVWVLRKIIICNDNVSIKLRQKIEMFYSLLQSEVFSNDL
jgi:hypothetical protein